MRLMTVSTKPRWTVNQRIINNLINLQVYQNLSQLKNSQSHIDEQTNVDMRYVNEHRVQRHVNDNEY